MDALLIRNCRFIRKPAVVFRPITGRPAVLFFFGAAVADAPRADAPTAASWPRVNCVGMGNSAIEPRPITSLPSPRECARQAVLFLVARGALREPRLIQRKAPAS